MQKNTATVNHINSALILASCVIAYLVPFELLLFSYAILGPAHYLTQIAWLHDRRYFVRADFNYHAVLLYFLSVPVVLFSAIAPMVIYVALTYAVVITGETRVFHKLCLGLFLLFLGAVLMRFHWFFPLMALTPTLIHVYIFTLLFMAAGLIRNYDRAGMISLVLLVVCGLQFLVFGHYVGNIFYPEYVSQNEILLTAIRKSLFEMLRISGDDASTWMVARFAAFAYTYHYLNWFSKTGIIGWHKMSKIRAAVIVLLYVCSIGVYAYD